MTKINLENIISDTKSFLAAELKPAEGRSVGRAFIVQTGDKKLTVKFKDLLDHLLKLAETETQSTQDPDALRGRVHQIVIRLEHLNRDGELHIKSKTRTAIHRFFGNLGRPSHIKLLHQIDKDYGQIDARQQFYEQIKGRTKFSNSEIAAFKELDPKQIELFLFELKKSDPKTSKALLKSVANSALTRKEQLNIFVQDCQKLAPHFSDLDLTTPKLAQGLKNLTNTCYMNASLQNLERIYVREGSACQGLLEQDLQMHEGETLGQLEERLLKHWAPIPIAETEEQILERQDQILFKWSFLLLMQAKRFGSAELLESALRTHLNISFGIKRHIELKVKMQQQDAAFYFELWHDMLGFNFKTYRQRVAEHEGQQLTKTFKSETATVWQLGLAKKTFGKLLHDQTSYKCDQKDLYTFELDDGKKVTPGEQDQFVRFDGTPPETLSIQIMRFAASKKISDPLLFGKFDPLKQDLALHPLFKEGQVAKGEANYRLTGIVVHLGGSIKSGHYVAYVSNPEGTGWLCYNDSQVSQVKPEDVPFQDAYMLTFQKVIPSIAQER